MSQKHLHLCEPPIYPLYTSEWPFDQEFCSFPKDDIFLGHPVVDSFNHSVNQQERKIIKKAFKILQRSVRCNNFSTLNFLGVS